MKLPCGFMRETYSGIHLEIIKVSLVAVKQAFLVDLTVEGRRSPCSSLTPASKPGATDDTLRSMKLAGKATS